MADKRITDLTAETALTRVDTFLETDHVTRGSEKASVENLLNRDQNNQTGTAYTLVLTDSQKRLTMNNGSANAVTVPPNSSVAFPINSVLPVFQLGAGRTSFVAGAGVTISSVGGLLKVSGRYGQSVLVKTAADVWVLYNVGDALTINTLAQFASTTSLQLKTLLSDETGSGAAVFATSPTLVAPALGTPASGVVTNLTGTASININGTVGASTPAAVKATTLNTTGNVGIGEATPTYKLVVDDDAASGKGLHVLGGGSGNTLARFERNVGSSGSYIDINCTSNDPQIHLAEGSDSWAVGVEGNVFEIVDGTNLAGTSKLEITTTTATFGTNLTLDASNSELNIKSGGDGTTGALNFTFNTTTTNYGGVDFAYGTRSTIGPRLWSINGYDCTVDSGNHLNLQTDGVTRVEVSDGATTIDHDLRISAGTSSTTAVQFYNPISSLCPELRMTRQGGSTSGNDFIKLDTSSGEVFSVDAAGGIDCDNILATSGIAFGTDTAAANQLDDYEEGTWTPTISFGGASVSLTYDLQVGTYTKIGDLVTASCYLSLTAKGSSTGAAVLAGMPFASRNLSGNLAATALRLSNISFADTPMGYNGSNASTITLQESTNAGTTTNLTEANFSNTSEIMMSVSYRV